MIRGFTCGAFDLLHAGHIAMLEEAKEQCDWLIVGLHTNPQLDRPNKNVPIQSIYERWLQLKGCKYVKEIIPYDTEKDLHNLLTILRPEVRILGEEYKDKEFTGKELPMKLYFNQRQHTFSSTELRQRLK